MFHTLFQLVLFDTTCVKSTETTVSEWEAQVLLSSDTPITSSGGTNANANTIHDAIMQHFART